MKKPSDAPKLKFAAITLPACAVVGGALRVAGVDPAASLSITTALLAAAVSEFAVVRWRRDTAAPIERRTHGDYERSTNQPERRRKAAAAG